MKLQDFDFRIWTGNNVRVILKTLPCEACGIQASATIRGKKIDYKIFFDFVKEKE